MITFLEWLKEININEAGAKGGYRFKGADLTNLSMGKLSPYSTFGHYDEPGLVKTAVGSLLQGIGDSMKKELAPVEAPSGVKGLDMSIFQKDNMIEMDLPLQLPIFPGQDQFLHGIMALNDAIMFRNIVSSLMRDMSAYMHKVNTDGKKDPQKFLLYNEESEREIKEKGIQLPEKSISLEQLAVNFTRVLCKIQVYFLLKEKYPKIENTYEIMNPTKLKDSVIDKAGFKVYKVLFKFNKQKHASYSDDDYDFGGI